MSGTSLVVPSIETSRNPPQNTPESVVIKLRRDGQPAANLDVWATVDYRTTTERWPTAGTVKTDASGSATITFNVGQATPGFPVQVHVFAQLDADQERVQEVRAIEQRVVLQADAAAAREERLIVLVIVVELVLRAQHRLDHLDR